MVRHFKEGDFVKQGQVVMELDKALEDLEVTRREVVLEPLKADYEASKYLIEQPKSSMSKELWTRSRPTTRWPSPNTNWPKKRPAGV